MSERPVDLSGKIALVTGASRGIGAAVARAYAGAGAHVIALARTIGGLEELDDAIRASGGAATLMPLDLTKSGDVDRLGPAIAERFGRLDIFVGNAAILGVLTPLAHIEPRQWQKVMDTNLTANFRLLRTLDPLLRRSAAGRVIFTASDLAQKPEPYWGLLAVSKAGLEALFRTYALETEKTSLRVNMVYPGYVRTAMLSEAFPGGYGGAAKDPEDVTDPFLELACEGCAHHGRILRA